MTSLPPGPKLGWKILPSSQEPSHAPPPPDDVRARLQENVSGPVLRPGMRGWDEAVKTWNARFTSRPDLVVRCQTPQDVQAAVDMACSEGLPLTVKSGGHDYAGNSAADGGLLVDLSPIASVTVHADERRVVVGPGATWTP